VDPRFRHAHFAAASCKNEFLLQDVVVSANAQLILYGRNLINFVAVKADPSETPVSCAQRLNDFRGPTFSRARISRTFSSVITFLFDCLFMSQTEPVACHSFTSLHTHDFVGTGEVGYVVSRG
jgi:hypothetical protein